MEWIRQIFESPEFGLAVLPAALALGLVTALSSACNVGIIAAVAGFSGSHSDAYQRRHVFLTTAFFLVGTIVSLAVLGLLMGYFGRLAGAGLGRYGMLAVGFVTIFFGLAALNLLPFRTPSFVPSTRLHKAGLWGAVLFGLLVGAASITCTLACCGPLLPVVLGVAAARGQAGWGALILTMFALGYSLPLAAIMLGVGLGRVSVFADKAVKPIRTVAGIVLLVVGFWILATL